MTEHKDSSKIIIEFLCRSGICKKITGDCIHDKCSEVKHLAAEVESNIKDNILHKFLKLARNWQGRRVIWLRSYIKAMNHCGDRLAQLVEEIKQEKPES